MTASTRNRGVQVLHFHDRRAPHEVQFQLERDLMILLHPETERPLCFSGVLPWGGMAFHIQLSFDAALNHANAYTLRVEASWPSRPEPENSRFLQSAESWFAFWTRGFSPSGPPQPAAGVTPRYEQLVRQALHAEDHLADVADIHRAIVNALRAGASYSTAHKEGGAIINCKQGHFSYAEYGESNETRRFGREPDFLDFLRRFYDSTITRGAAPSKLSEYDAWKLILRLLDPPRGG